jgi:hypothetical protein
VGVVFLAEPGVGEIRPLTTATAVEYKAIRSCPTADLEQAKVHRN